MGAALYFSCFKFNLDKWHTLKPQMALAQNAKQQHYIKKCQDEEKARVKKSKK